MHWLFLVVFLMGAAQAQSQSLLDSLKADSIPFPMHRAGVVAGEARDFLAKLWNDSSATQPERAYCVTRWTQTPDAVLGTQLFVVLKVALPDSVVSASPVHISSICPTGSPTIHIHTPTSCSATPAAPPMCQIGGPLAYFCGPSLRDLATWLDRPVTSPFNIVQCDTRAFVFYWTVQTPAGLTITSR